MEQKSSCKRQFIDDEGPGKNVKPETEGKCDTDGPTNLKDACHAAKERANQGNQMTFEISSEESRGSDTFCCKGVENLLCKLTCSTQN